MRPNGFTLIEIVVATALAGLMVISVANLFIITGDAQRQSQRLETATHAGELKIESLRNKHYNSLEPGTTIDFTDELPPELNEPRSAQVEISEPQPGLRRLDLHISYYDGTRKRGVDLSTVIGNVGIAQ
jgi:prepilin-type N-terminal cleavage/methylation domain-containing protein